MVHKKIDYRSMSTIYIGGLSTVKNKYFCLEMVFIHGKKKYMFEGVSGNSRRMSIRDLQYHPKGSVARERENTRTWLSPYLELSDRNRERLEMKTYGCGYHPDLELSDRGQERLEMKTHGQLSHRLRVE